MTARELFREAMDWLRENYASFRFYTERDVVWTVQERLRRDIEERGLPLRVFNDYGVLPGKRRSFSADLAVLDEHEKVLLAVEFKYEPSHRRSDIPKKKFPVVFWGKEGVGKDVDRVERFVTEGDVVQALALFIDEGGLLPGASRASGLQVCRVECSRWAWHRLLASQRCGAVVLKV